MYLCCILLKACSQLHTVQQASTVKSAMHLFPLWLPPKSTTTGLNAEVVRAELRSVCQWIPCSVLFSLPNILQKYRYFHLPVEKKTFRNKLVTLIAEFLTFNFTHLIEMQPLLLQGLGITSKVLKKQFHGKIQCVHTCC